MLRKMRNTEGFTLIELMIVIAIIGILAAIAIPNFVAYRQRSYNSAAQTDLKNAMTTQEAYFVDNEIYANTVDKLTAAGLRQSKNVTFETPVSSTTGYTMTAYHTSGNVTWHVAGPDSTMTSN